MQDVFELQRNLNNAFAYDLVPSPSVITAALRAARRVNDFPTAVRVFEGMSYNTDLPLPAGLQRTSQSWKSEDVRVLMDDVQASRPKSRTRASTTSTSKSSSPCGKSWASTSRRACTPMLRRRSTCSSAWSVRPLSTPSHNARGGGSAWRVRRGWEGCEIIH